MYLCLLPPIATEGKYQLCHTLSPVGRLHNPLPRESYFSSSDCSHYKTASNKFSILITINKQML